MSESGGYVAAEDTGEMQRDAFTLTVHEYTVDVATADDTVWREGGTVTLELLPTDGLFTHLPILFLEADTEYEVRVRPLYTPSADGVDDFVARAPSSWSESGFGRTSAPAGQRARGDAGASGSRPRHRRRGGDDPYRGVGAAQLLPVAPFRPGDLGQSGLPVAAAWKPAGVKLEVGGRALGLHGRSRYGRASGLPRVADRFRRGSRAADPHRAAGRGLPGGERGGRCA